jgi:hypothetical protein
MACALNRRMFLKALGTGAAALAVSRWPGAARAAEQAGGAARKLNFIFVLLDDMGWRDLGCFGSPFYETPHIDRLASQGMRFTDAYAAGPVCSPTRASILTGRHPARLHMTDYIGGSRTGKLLPAKYLDDMVAIVEDLLQGAQGDDEGDESE